MALKSGIGAGQFDAPQPQSAPTAPTPQQVKRNERKEKERQALEEAVSPSDPAENLFRDAGFVRRERDRARSTGTRAAGRLRTLSQRALDAGDFGVDVGQQGQQRISNLGATSLTQGQRFGDFAEQAAGRQAPQTNFRPANANLAGAQDLASQLVGIEGAAPSAAQAQLQSGLNQAQRTNLALARSGRGFGQSASALDAAIVANAQQGQEAANQAAILRAGEDAAQRERQATNLAQAAGIDLDTARQRIGQAEFQTQAELEQTGLNQQAALDAFGLQQSSTGQAIGAETAGADVALRGAGLGLQGTQAAVTPITAGAGLEFAGQQMGLDVAGQAAATEAADSDRMLQKHGIDKGVSIQKANARAQRDAALIGGIATGIATLTAATIAPPAAPAVAAAGVAATS